MSSKARELANLGNAYSDGALSNRNKILNGAMVIDQRNGGSAVTINANSNTYTLDRWSGYGATSDGVFTIQQSSTAPSGFVNSLLATVTTADASVAATQLYIGARQKIEGFNFADLGWGTSDAKTVTLSFWVRSSLTGTFGGSITNGGQDRSYPFSYSISAADTWEYKTVTIAGDTSGTWLTTTGIGADLFFSLGTGSTYSGTAGAWAGAPYYSVTGAVSLIGTLNATWQITGVQLEVGDTATPFEHRSYGQELALCQRYYQTDKMYLQGYQVAPNDYSIMYQYPVVMRTNPTLSFTATADISTNVNVGTAGPTPNGSYGKQARFYVDPANTGYVEYNRAFEADAEL